MLSKLKAADKWNLRSDTWVGGNAIIFIFSNSLSQLVITQQERPRVLGCRNSASPDEKPELGLAVVPRVSKVKATWRGFFANRLFNRPKRGREAVHVVAACFAR